MERRIDINFVALKYEFDNLFKGLNAPYDVVPEWTGAGVSLEVLQEAEARMDVAFPEVLKDVSGQFSAIYHETPYFLGNAFKKIQSEVIKRSRREISEDCFKDDLEISIVYAPAEWDGEDAQGLKALNVEYMSEMDAKQYIGVDCDLMWLHDRSFLLIGATYSESLYMDLREPASNPHYGALYNFNSLEDFCILYKVADDYGQFLLNIKHSLEKKIQLDAEDGDDN